MDVPVGLLDDPGESQRGASDPGASVWVAASAGTGKTKVLSDRVLRLMLNGTDPRRILCLTYTKAASAEMANRIAERLGDWATADAAQLERRLIDLLGKKPSTEQQRLARQLLARVLDAPGGLAIQTIHAFCQSLLARFPLEAGVAPHSTIMDDRDAADLLAEARYGVLEEAVRTGGPLAAALATVTRYMGEGGFAGLMGEMIKAQARLAAMLAANGGLAAVVAEMRDRLGLDPDDTPARVVAAGCSDGAVDVAGLRHAAEALAGGSPTDCGRGAVIAGWIEADGSTRVDTFAHYAGAFLTKEEGSAPRKVRATLMTKKLAAAAPEALDVLQAEADRLLCVLPRVRSAMTAEATEALLVVGLALMTAYRRLKESRALLDYGDLIDKAAGLLQGEGSASWVLYKLDGGIDHVLIDEAQDTSPEQWQVIKDLTREFFVGQGARDIVRTIFAVGDVKQSIFSFQGADPAAFLATRDVFAQRVPQVQWRPLELKTSFRSTRAVLEAVDATFADPEMALSIALEPDIIVHQAFRQRDGGSVEVWPTVTARDPEKPEPWAPPVKRVDADSPQRRLAILIALRIQAMLQDGERLDSQGRPIQAGDIMVLVRRRTLFVQALVRALKERQLPTAGVDRMMLTEQLAVMDLMALGRFVLLPGDDLTLATVLKGPLVGLDDEALFALAWGRTGSLWRALQDRARTDPACAAARGFLAEALALADVVPPFEFFMRILGPAAGMAAAGGSGRHKILSRLGREAEDPISEFLELCLAYERIHPPSLQGFLHWLESSDVEIKRDPEQGRQQAVQVMTVHGAKGLQAPIVFLPDTCQLPDAKETLLWVPGRDGRGEVVLWPPRSAIREQVAETERRRAAARQMQEYRRLLYVAMTRASDRLIVCGWLTGKQKNGPPADSWHNAIATGLKGRAVESEDVFLARHAAPTGLIDEAKVLRITCAQERTAEQQPRPDEAVPQPLPPWATAKPPSEPPPLRPLRPSHAEEDALPVLAPLVDPLRFQRGRLIHRLLQELPGLAAGERGEAARRWLAQPVHGLTVDAREAIAAEVMAVIADPGFAALFGPGSRAEVPLSGEIDGRLVAGQVDRLLVEADEVVVLDYKSDRPPPGAAEDVPPGYLRQMAAYRTLLRRVYPDRPVRCLLLWTQAPRAMALDDTLLDRWAP